MNLICLSLNICPDDDNNDNLAIITDHNRQAEKIRLAENQRISVVIYQST